MTTIPGAAAIDYDRHWRIRLCQKVYENLKAYLTAEDAEERQARTATVLASGLNPKRFQPPAPSLFTLRVIS